MDRWVDKWMDEWLNGWMGKWMDEWMSGWMDEYEIKNKMLIVEANWWAYRFHHKIISTLLLWSSH